MAEHKVIFRGGKFDGRSRDFGPDPMPVIELATKDGPQAYVNTGEKKGDAIVYAFNPDARGSLPFVVHFSGGPHNGNGRRFAAQPADVIVIPLGDGKFARYRKDPRTPAPGQPLLYSHAETFEGEKS
jgi:hypothetical protein